MKTNPKTINGYIAGFPADIQQRLRQVRVAIRRAAPGAEEKIGYGIPSFFFLGRHLVYFAAFKKHVGFYAAPTGTAAFKKQLSSYKTGRGSIQFPFDRPLPLGLIARIVKFRAKENQRKAETKKK